MTVVFLAISILIILFQYRREKNVVNCVSLLVAPYVVVVFFNATFFEKHGFYKISNEVLFMILTSFIAFFIGSMIATPRTIPKIYEADNGDRYEQYNINGMTNFVIIIGIIGLIKLVQLVLTGGFRTDFDGMEGIMGNGIVGHLLLVSYALVPIIFLYWLEHKKEIKCLLSVVLILGDTFSTLIKYNIIGVIVSLFIFTTMYKKSLLKKAIIIMATVVVLVFIGNYALGFALRSVSVDNEFYLNHLWGYAGGSVLYDNGIFTGAVANNQSVIFRLGIFLFALPNMFIRKINNGIGIFQHVRKPFQSIGFEDGMESNVTDAFGYLFPYKLGIGEMIIYYLLILLLGIIFTRIYIRSKRNSNYFNIVTCNFLTYFVFFSFFGAFYINSGPWEILVYSAIIPCIFLKGSDIVHGKIRIPKNTYLKR